MEVAIGRIAKAHGVRGELAVDPITDSPEVRFAPGARMTARHRNGSSRALTVAAARPHGARLLVTFEEVSGRDAAEKLRGHLLLADTADLPPIEDPDEFYDYQLEGLAVLDGEGTRLGTVTEVLHTPAAELLSVDADGQEVLVPFVRQIVPEVNLAAGALTVDPPPGLFPGTGDEPDGDQSGSDQSDEGG